MEPKVFSKNSIHWRLASHYGPLEYYETNTDICRYTRAVLRGLVAVIFFTFVLGAIAAGLVLPVAYVAACMSVGIWFPPGPEVLIMPAIIVALALMAGYLFLKSWWEDKKIEQMKAEKAQGVPTKSPSAWTEMYRAFKQKTCFKVQIQGDDETQDE